MILAADKLNPSIAARLVPPLGRWKRFDEARAGLMRAELERIVAAPGLSKDVYEQAYEEPGLGPQPPIQLATSSATWLAAWLSAGPTVAASPLAGTRASKRRVSTRAPPAVDFAAS